MKSKLIQTLICVALSTFSANAASYILTNSNSSNTVGIADSTNKAFQNSSNAAFAGPGSAAYGYFNISNEEIAGAGAASTLIGGFNSWGSTVNFTGPGFGGTKGFFTNSAPQRAVTGSEFAGKNLYVMVGNGPSFDASTEFLVLETTFTFNPADDSNPLPINLLFDATNSTVVLGNLVAEGPLTTNSDTVVSPGWQTVNLIPEPSVALLGALGGLALLRRRRA